MLARTVTENFLLHRVCMYYMNYENSLTRFPTYIHSYENHPPHRKICRYYFVIYIMYMYIQNICLSEEERGGGGISIKNNHNRLIVFT